MAINDIQFKRTITLSEKVRLVTNIVESLFFDDGYMPEIYEEQFWISVAEAYLDEGLSLDSTADEFMDAYYNGGLREKLDESINNEQLESIRVAVDKRIEMRLSKRPADEFFEKAAVLLAQIENTLTGVDLKGALDAFGKLDVSAEIAKALAKNRSTKEGK